MGAQRLRGSQSRLNFTGVINRGGKWNQDALDAHDLRASCGAAVSIADGISPNAGWTRHLCPMPAERRIAHYRVMHNSGVALEFRIKAFLPLRVKSPFGGKKFEN